MPKTQKMLETQGVATPMESNVSIETCGQTAVLNPKNQENLDNPSETRRRYLATSEYCGRYGFVRQTVLNRRKEDPAFDALWLVWGGKNYIAIEDVEADEARMKADAISAANKRVAKRASAPLDAPLEADHNALARQAATAIRSGERRINTPKGPAWGFDPYFLQAPISTDDVRDPYFANIRLLVGNVPTDIREKLHLTSNATWWDVWSTITRDKSEALGRLAIERDASKRQRQAQEVEAPYSRDFRERQEEKRAQRLADMKAAKERGEL